jgi:hypothetical protein
MYRSSVLLIVNRRVISGVVHSHQLFELREHRKTVSRDRLLGLGGGQVPNLKKLEPDERVAKITHCRDTTYRVTTADGKTRAFWERNLRFKTDAGEGGPEKGAPAIVGAGMMGDRADVIFAAPEEISGSIASEC